MHYTRSAPLKTIADDMKKNAASKASDKAIHDVGEMTISLKAAMDAIIVDYEARFMELKVAVAAAEKLAKPRSYVTNRKSGKVHKILTRVEDMGSEALCYCSFRYAKAPVKISQELPIVTRDLYCSTCLADVRAEMAKE